MLTVDPKFMALLASLRILLVVVGSILADNHLGSPGLYHAVMAAAGSVIALGSALWGVYATFMALWKAKAVGVQAGINLVSSGRALDTSGNLIKVPSVAPSPKPVTLETAAQIVRTFGPAPSEIPRA